MYPSSVPENLAAPWSASLKAKVDV
jgi:hypothetical protein